MIQFPVDYECEGRRKRLEELERDYVVESVTRKLIPCVYVPQPIEPMKIPEAIEFVSHLEMRENTDHLQYSIKVEELLLYNFYRDRIDRIELMPSVKITKTALIFWH